MNENKKEAELVERLAALEHEQWLTWTQDVAGKNDLSIETFEHWRKLWIPYSELSEEMKELNREWARKVLESIRKNHILLNNHDLSDEERKMAKDVSNVFR